MCGKCRHGLLRLFLFVISLTRPIADTYRRLKVNAISMDLFATFAVYPWKIFFGENEPRAGNVEQLPAIAEKAKSDIIWIYW